VTNKATRGDSVGMTQPNPASPQRPDGTRAGALAARD
jgi:hypothetical protein